MAIGLKGEEAHKGEKKDMNERNKATEVLKK